MIRDIINYIILLANIYLIFTLLRFFGIIGRSIFDVFLMDNYVHLLLIPVLFFISLLALIVQIIMKLRNKEMSAAELILPIINFTIPGGFTLWLTLLLGNQA